MSMQPEKPDFIADQYGNVQDVRHLKYSNESASSPSQNLDATPSQYGDSNRSGSRPSQKQIGKFI